MTQFHRVSLVDLDRRLSFIEEWISRVFIAKNSNGNSKWELTLVARGWNKGC